MKVEFCNYWCIPIENVHEIDEELIDCNFDCDECYYGDTENNIYRKEENKCDI